MIGENGEKETDKITKEKVVKIENGKNFIKETNDKAKSNAYIFGKAFGARLKSDKLFLLSFIITIIFLCFFAYNTLKNSESAYPGFLSNLVKEEEEVSTTTDTSDKTPVTVDEKLDVSDKVGIYSKEFSLNEKVVLSDTCTVESYKLVYQIKKDKSIIKYLYNDCMGAIKIWDGSLDYVMVGETKYIGTEEVHFLFTNTEMREADGDTFKIDDTISSIKENNNIKNLDVTFIDNNIIFVNNTNLVLMRGNSVVFNLNEKYPNKGGKLDKYVYEIDDNNYNFIVFNNNENINCYEDSKEETNLYTIYSIKFDKDTSDFSSPKELVTRTKKDGCVNFDKDMDILEGNNS